MNNRRLVFISLFVIALLACSSKVSPTPTNQSPTTADTSTGDDTSPPAVDGGNGGSSSSSSGSVPVDAGRPAPTDYNSCIADCQFDHPAATKLNSDLDANCFLGGACESSCDNLGTGAGTFGPDLGDGGTTACDLSNSWEVETSSASCSTCIVQNLTCCNLWKELFTAPTLTTLSDGQSLLQCSVDCSTKFPSK